MADEAKKKFAVESERRAVFFGCHRGRGEAPVEK